jgi:hypothetical protein
MKLSLTLLSSTLAFVGAYAAQEAAAPVVPALKDATTHREVLNSIFPIASAAPQVIAGFLADSPYLNASKHNTAIQNLFPGEPCIFEDSISEALSIRDRNKDLGKFLREYTFDKLTKARTLEKIQLTGHTAPVIYPPAENMQAVVKNIFGPQDKYLLTASADKTARVWDIEGKKSFILYGHTDTIVQTGICANKTSVITGDRKGTVIYWNFITKRMVVCSGHMAEITRIECSHNTFKTVDKKGITYVWKVVDTADKLTVTGMQDRQKTLGVAYQASPAAITQAKSTLVDGASAAQAAGAEKDSKQDALSAADAQAIRRAQEEDAELQRALALSMQTNNIQAQQKADQAHAQQGASAAQAAGAGQGAKQSALSQEDAQAIREAQESDDEQPKPVLVRAVNGRPVMMRRLPAPLRTISPAELARLAAAIADKSNVQSMNPVASESEEDQIARALAMSMEKQQVINAQDQQQIVQKKADIAAVERKLEKLSQNLALVTQELETALEAIHQSKREAANMIKAKADVRKAYGTRIINTTIDIHAERSRLWTFQTDLALLQGADRKQTITKLNEKISADKKKVTDMLEKLRIHYDIK